MAHISNDAREPSAVDTVVTVVPALWSGRIVDRARDVGRCQPKASRSANSRKILSTAEASSDPRQPRRFEKNKNTAGYFPAIADPNRLTPVSFRIPTVTRSFPRVVSLREHLRHRAYASRGNAHSKTVEYVEATCAYRKRRAGAASVGVSSEVPSVRISGRARDSIAPVGPSVRSSYPLPPGPRQRWSAPHVGLTASGVARVGAPRGSVDESFQRWVELRALHPVARGFGSVKVLNS